MDIQLSNRVNRIKPSPTLAVAQRAAELKARGRDIVSLGVGEPDFDTPEFIKEAAIKAIRDGKTKYTPVEGIPSLKEAIVEKLARFNGLTYRPDQVIVSSGGKQCIYNFLQAVVQEGDEVIIPSPYWVSYPDMVLLADGIPIFIQTRIEDRFKVTPEQLEAVITPRSRVLMINGPSNPTGIAYTREELLGLAAVLKKHPQILIATDDMYEHILWTAEPFQNILMVCPELYDRTIVLNGVSKAYSMTGWRIGYASGPRAIIRAMSNIQGQSTSNPCSIAQAAAEAALRGGLESTQRMVDTFKQRHDYLVAQLNAIEGIYCLPSDGTFYSFPSFEKAMARMEIASDVEFAEHLIETVGLALVPGSAFGKEGYMRLSYAVGMPVLEQAVARLQQACQSG